MATHLRRLAALATILAGLPAAAAEGSGAISGVTLDVANGKPLVGALVQLTGPALEGPRTLLSGDAGKFVLEGLPPGTYALTVSRDGYQPFQRSELAVPEGETVRVGAWLTPEGAPVEEVVVTGSRIRRKDVSTPAPVTIIDREQIERSGVVGLGEFLQRLPEQIGGLNAQMNNTNQGQVLFSLRGLDSKRTLVLLNGRRMVGGGLGGETMVDLNTIPLAAVERVEVMKDGASAIYGSDAVAGVVNVILKKQFEGTELSVQGGTSGQGDAQSYDLSFSTGLTGKRGSAFFSVGYQEQRPLDARDRRWAASGLTYDFPTRSVSKDGSAATPSGTVELYDPATDCADPGSIANPVLRGACEAFQATGDVVFIRDPQTGAYRPFSPATDLYNYQTDYHLLTPARRLQLFTAGNLQLAPSVQAFYEASFVHRRSARQYAPAPAALLVPGNSLYNDFGTDVIVIRRLVEAGARRYTSEVNTFRVALGLEGEVGGWAGPLEGWNWELAYVFGRNSARDTSEGILRTPQLDAATGPSFDDGGTPTCGTPDAPIAGCVPLDVMGGPGTLTPEQRRELVFSGISHGYQEQHVVSADASGDLFTLWANRPAGLAVGLEARREAGGFFPDPISAAGEASEGNQPAVEGAYSTREGYAELSIPLVGQRPGVEDLELTAALRHVRYTTFGNDTSYKLGGRWMPVRDVTLRGTWSTAFRAPGILELYTGNAATYDGATDPCIAPTSAAVREQCLREAARLPTDDGGGQVPTLEGGNTKLEPETARILTAGVVLEPRWVKGLTLTADYWDITLEDAVEKMGAANILTRCYTGDDSGAEFCERVHRDAMTGALVQVDDRLINSGRIRTAGIDLAASSVLPTRVAGTFRLGFDATYLLRYDRTFPDGSVVEAAGTYDLTLLLPRWKWNASVGWLYGPFGLTTDARYVGSLDECGNQGGTSGGGSCADNPQYTREVRSNLVFDLAASYERKTALGTTAVLVGVRNVLDSEPPKIFNAGDNNTDPGYDYVGRYYWARVSQRF